MQPGTGPMERWRAAAGTPANIVKGKICRFLVPRRKVQELAVGALGPGYQMSRVGRAVLAVEAGAVAPGPVGPAAAG